MKKILSLGIKDPFLRIVAWLAGCGGVSAGFALFPIAALAFLVAFAVAAIVAVRSS